MSGTQEVGTTASIAIQVDLTSEVINQLQNQLAAYQSEQRPNRTDSMDNLVVHSRRPQCLAMEQQLAVGVRSTVLTELNSKATLRVIPFKRMQGNPTTPPPKRTVEVRLRSRQRGIRRNEELNKQLQKAYSTILENKHRRSPIPRLTQADSSSRLSPSRQDTRRPQMDWGLSQLNDFQKRESLQSLEQLPQLDRSETEHDIKKTYNKVLGTAERLRDQLGLSESWLVMPPCSRKGLGYLFNACERLYRMRGLTVDVLERIQQREQLVLRMMKCGPHAICQTYNKVIAAGAEVLQAVKKWKESELPYQQFVYLGHDIESKIRTDDKRLNVIYQQSLAQLAKAPN